MNRRQLLKVLAELEPVRVTGRFERHTSPEWKPLSRGSTAGGRWGARGAFEVLYLGRPRASVVAEAYRHLIDDELDSTEELAAHIGFRRVVGVEVDVPDVIDLRGGETQRRLGIADGALQTQVGDYDHCQRIGAAAHQLQASGVIAPSASGMGETLALFPLNISAENLPTVAEEELWQGLPPDPRRLRLVDEDSS